MRAIERAAERPSGGDRWREIPGSVIRVPPGRLRARERPGSRLVHQPPGREREPANTRPGFPGRLDRAKEGQARPEGRPGSPPASARRPRKYSTSQSRLTPPSASVSSPARSAARTIPSTTSARSRPAVGTRRRSHHEGALDDRVREEEAPGIGLGQRRVLPAHSEEDLSVRTHRPRQTAKLVWSESWVTQASAQERISTPACSRRRPRSMSSPLGMRRVEATDGQVVGCAASRCFPCRASRRAGFQPGACCCLRSATGMPALEERASPPTASGQWMRRARHAGFPGRARRGAAPGNREAGSCRRR